MGDSAWLLETADAAEAQRWRATLLAETLPGVRELVPGYRSLLIEFDPLAAGAAALPSRIDVLAGGPLQRPVPREHELPVRYDGEDLAAVAGAAGLSIADVIRRHVQVCYTVAFLGFAPGFAYLTGLDAALKLPRRANPRTRVSAGSVAIADEFTGIYPQATPGGWHILGRCDTKLFDISVQPPALLAPGDFVRFRETP
jgi:KipI family sensor histidine kinase inhibitor